MIILEGGGAKAVKVRDASGALIVDLSHGGFITVVQNGLETARGRSGIDAALPVRLVSYRNGRLSLEDPLTGWNVELHAFGADNEAKFSALLAE
jgi:putative photosynthetic complex assembly protein